MAKMEFSLKIEGPEGFTVDFPIPTGTTQIGRQAGNGLVLAHTQVSRNHARIDAAADSCSITDLGSSNGTHVNGEKLEPNSPARLKDGDRVKIGPFQIEVAGKPVPEETLEHEAPAADPSIVSEIAPAEEGPDPAEKPEPEPEKPSEKPEAAARDMQAPPPPSGGLPPTAPVSVNGHPGHVPGLTRHSSVLLDFLPGIYHTDFMSRFLAIFEATLLPLEWTIDSFDQFLDPEAAPAGFLPWLASWYGLVFDSTWTEAQRRQLLAEAHEIFARRGTRRALSRVLEIYTGTEPEIDDDARDLDAFTFSVVIPRRKRDVRSDLIEALIDAHKPAHTTYKLRFKG